MTDMRRPRLIATGEGVYHVISRTAFRRFALRPEERNAFVRLLARVAAFSGVRILTFAVMSNHFHLLVRVPERREVPDEELERRVRVLLSDMRADSLFAKWARWRDMGAETAAEEAKERLRARMYDLSQFCKTLKESFTMDYNRRTGNAGSIWGGRFRSVIVAPEATALFSVGAYVDANPVKAGMVRHARDYRWAGFAEALRGSAFARDGIVELVRLARGASVGPSFGEAAVAYAAALEGRLNEKSVVPGPNPTTSAAPGSDSITAPDSTVPDRRKIAEKLSQGSPLTFAEMLLCEVPVFERGGSFGPRQFVVPLSMQRNGRDRTTPACLAIGLFLWTDHPLSGPPLRLVS